MSTLEDRLTAALAARAGLVRSGPRTYGYGCWTC